MRRIHAAVFVAALGVVIVYTWPLASDLAHLFPDNPDPRTLTWVLLSVFRNLLVQPGAFLQGNAFYPVGLSLTFTEPLIVPALVAGPLHALTGNPVLAHNLALLLFWALSGWILYMIAYRLTRDHVAALVGAAVFTLCPYRTETYLEFQMEMVFGVPLAVYTLVRFLESQRARYLAAFCLVFWAQAISVLYYAVILACGLSVVAVEYAALRWTGWRARTFLVAMVGAGLLGLALAPVLESFLVTRSELGFERRLAEVQEQSAELLTYVELRPNRLYRAKGGGYFHETSLFLGGVALGLAGLGLLWLRRERPAPPGWPERSLTIAMVVAVVLAGIAVATRGRAGVLPKGLSFSVIGVGLFGCLLARQAVEGWRRRRGGLTDRQLAPRDWVMLLLGLALVAFLLSLGPVVHLARRPIGPGLYAWLYPYVLPLRGIRAATRIGFLVVLAGALLAAFGVTWLRARLPRPAFIVVTGVAGLLLLLEYATFPLAYGRVPSVARPVDAALRAAPADAVVLEWPANVPLTDADAMLRSLVHGKRIVNGYSGFVPRLLADLSRVLTISGPPFPAAEVEGALRRIYPLGFLVVRLADPALTPEWRAAWTALRHSPPSYLRFRGTYGDDDLWAITPELERGTGIERWVSYDFLRTHPVVRATLRPLGTDPTVEPSVEVALNGRVIVDKPIGGDGVLLATLSRPYFRAKPNVVELRFAYRRPWLTPDERYRIGLTGATSPGDLEVRSAGQPHGEAASITFNLRELAANRRGYNLVALDPDGRVRATGVFDTFFDPAAASRLARFVADLPAGTLVAGAVRDEASGRLTGEAVDALRTLGVAGDLRGRFRQSHAFVGVKGSASGTAIEALGDRAVAVTLGRAPGVTGFELAAFALEGAGGR